jgi:hypothetical protein
MVGLRGRWQSQALSRVHFAFAGREVYSCAAMKELIMYIERKAGALTGSGTIRYRDHVFHRIFGGGFKSNYVEEATGEDYWISGCKRRGGDRMYGSPAPIEIDEDAREEYWSVIRNLPDERHKKCA